MSKFAEETMQGLIEAVAISKNEAGVPFEIIKKDLMEDVGFRKEYERLKAESYQNACTNL